MHAAWRQTAGTEPYPKAAFDDGRVQRRLDIAPGQASINAEIINPVAVKYGGGHAKARGATVCSRQEAEALIRDMDAHIKEYKETHDGWL